MIKNFPLVVVLLLQFVSVGTITSEAAISECFDYGYSCAKGGYKGYDDWGFYAAGSPGNGGNHNCTSYAAYRASTNGSRRPQGNLGHAGQWAGNAQAFGFLVDNNPAVGAVAQWIYGVYGHVAYVESINNDGSLTISQDNYDIRGSMRGGWTEITRVTRNSGWPHNFIHFADVQKSSLNTRINRKVNDINGDGKSDLLFRNKLDGTVTSWTTQGDNLAKNVAYGSFGSDFKNWESLGMGDVNGDGRSDLFVKNKLSGIVNVWTTNSQNTATNQNYGTFGSGVDKFENF
jgi:surface antigen